MLRIILAFSIIFQSLCTKSILILRHGARDPQVWTEFDQLYLWTNPIKILTQKGVDQLIEVGTQQQRQSIFDSQGNCIYEMLEIQSSKTARCTSSTVCFIIGLCPKNYKEILHRFFSEYYSNRVLSQKKFQKILESDFSDPLSLDYDIFDTTGDFMFQGHKTKQCPNLKPINSNVQNSKQYKNKEKEFKQMDQLNGVYEIMVKAYPSKTIDKSALTLTDVDDIYDDTFCNQFEGFLFPNPSLSTYNYMGDVVKFLKYFGQNSEMFQHQASLTEPFKWIISQFYSQEQFSVYIGTESNQFAMLSVLVDEQYLTPFASELEFIIKGNMVYIYFNKVQLKTKMCESGYYCTIDQVVQFMHQYIVQDVRQLCGL
ncbi:unnamed protein product (macronuclear) [Paramecium tetraurelia]|uniref:Histidine phosphatase family (Branch 2) protein n=1 Tax=Paramecium tetraurelia TaxID=5888 RepID=A0E7M8_PARTE|nr:uncharacterized protein GSPATT00024023001 [Paramecium tetraurelia]CAK91295.1 unnamed protein product [Paramecium tetraurelia]|eukprot:XP_001458692.1 hypothetical protein (macronuclear) [Paramecium tetraurelia strain d4-2]